MHHKWDKKISKINPISICVRCGLIKEVDMIDGGYKYSYFLTDGFFKEYPDKCTLLFIESNIKHTIVNINASGYTIETKSNDNRAN
jgi:hypothetical protein